MNKKRQDKRHTRFVLKPQWILVLLVLAALSPFLAKPFNIDDPLFIWAARHIQIQPANPYNFNVNWYGWVQPMWLITQNPPLICYFIAVCGATLGWSELALHAVFLLPALAVILGTYNLARRFCNQPFLAAAITLFTPVFLVSSTTLMCDVMMLVFWVWAVVWWVEGSEQKDVWRLSGAALFMALAALTKYFGVCLLPLLAAWSLIGKRRARGWIGYFVIPLAILISYQVVTYMLYGHNLLLNAYYYTAQSGVGSHSEHLQTALTALAFTGGGLAIAALFMLVLYRPRALAPGILISVLAATGLCIGASISKLFSPWSSPMLVVIQIIFWASGGIGLLVLAVTDYYKRRNADSALLGLWVGGTFVFTACLNWTVNGRSILPMSVPIGILVVRQLQEGAGQGMKVKKRIIAAMVAVGAMLALSVTRADFLSAKAARQIADRTQAEYGQTNHTLWFEGHHGFQYYIEKAGASALDFRNSRVQWGDYVAIPLNTPNCPLLDESLVTQQNSILVAGSSWLTTMDVRLGAGFYSSISGPLPFAFGKVPAAQVLVFSVTRPTGSIGNTK